LDTIVELLVIVASETYTLGSPRVGNDNFASFSQSGFAVRDAKFNEPQVRAHEI